MYFFYMNNNLDRCLPIDLYATALLGVLYIFNLITLCMCTNTCSPFKSAYQKIIFLISQPKHMLWVL